MLFVEGNRFGDVDVAHSISVSHTEGIFSSNIVRDFLESTASTNTISSIDEGHAPGLGDTLVNLHLILFHVESDVGHMQEIIREVFLDQVAFVPTADYEIVDAVSGIDLEDMPEDRTAPDFDHRFGTCAGLFTQPCSLAACQNDSFH